MHRLQLSRHLTLYVLYVAWSVFIVSCETSQQLRVIVFGVCPILYQLSYPC